MKVLHILNSLLPSGAEIMLKTAGKYWNSEFEHHILATAKDLGVFAPELENAGYTIHHIYNPDRLKQLHKVKKFIQQERFDIVHVHRESCALGYEVIAKLAGAKCVVRTVHSVFAFEGFLRIRRIITRQLGCFIGVKHVAIGKSVLENEKRRFFVNCELVHNWYDENKFTYVDSATKQSARKQLGVAENTLCLVSVGNCSNIKNHMAILKALTSVKDKNVVYLHVGKGKDEPEERAYVEENHLEPMVRFEGFQDPLIYLQAADCYIMLSTYEGVGISALEAMATGMPCLLTDVSGLKDFKKYHFDLVEYCGLDDESIALAIKQLTEDARKENSAEQSKKVKQNYGIKQGVAGYQEVYLKSCNL